MGRGFTAWSALGAWVLVAIAAPLVASSSPLLAWGDGGVSSPWLLSLLDPIAYPSPLDRALNAALLAAPVALLGRGRGWGRGAGAWLAAAACVFALASAGLWPRAAPGPGNPATTHALATPIAFGPRDAALVRARLGPSLTHPLGTDTAGRDVAARLVFGARVSLAVGLVATLLATLVGAALGAAAGYAGGVVDLVVSRVVEAVMVVPSLFLVLTVATFVESRSVLTVIALLVLVQWTTPARLARAELLRLRSSELALAARVSGYRGARLVFGQLLPNALGPLVVSATFGVAGTILAESTLGFLGLGDPELPSWGQLLALGRHTSTPTLVVAPGLAILGVVLTVNRVGEAVRARLLDRDGVASRREEGPAS
jgi:peptide/nickel transport system permease protein